MKQRLRSVCVFLFLMATSTGNGFAAPSPTSTSSINQLSSVVNVIYKSGVLTIQGLTGQGNVKIYSIIGNEIATYSRVDLINFQRNITLNANTMYIVHVELAGETKLYKFVAR